MLKNCSERALLGSNSCGAYLAWFNGYSWDYKQFRIPDIEVIHNEGSGEISIHLDENDTWQTMPYPCLSPSGDDHDYHVIGTPPFTQIKFTPMHDIAILAVIGIYKWGIQYYGFQYGYSGNGNYHLIYSGDDLARYYRPENYRTSNCLL